MARRVAWTESAWQELESAAAYIARDSPRYAAALIAEHFRVRLSDRLVEVVRLGACRFGLTRDFVS